VVGKAGPIKPERDAASGRTQAITISEERNDTAWLRSFFFFRLLLPPSRLYLDWQTRFIRILAFKTAKAAGISELI
jgi:hypothetical protein